MNTAGIDERLTSLGAMQLGDVRWKRSARDERSVIPVDVVSGQANDADGPFVVDDGVQVPAVPSADNELRRGQRDLRIVQHRNQRRECSHAVATIPPRASEGRRVERALERFVLHAELGVPEGCHPSTN
jgi:hypothetical protein